MKRASKPRRETRAKVVHRRWLAGGVTAAGLLAGFGLLHRLQEPEQEYRATQLTRRGLKN